MIIFLVDLIKKTKRLLPWASYELIFLDVPVLVFVLSRVF